MESQIWRSGSPLLVLEQTGEGKQNCLAWFDCGFNFISHSSGSTQIFSSDQSHHLWLIAGPVCALLIFTTTNLVKRSPIRYRNSRTWHRSSFKIMTYRGLSHRQWWTCHFFAFCEYHSTKTSLGTYIVYSYNNYMAIRNAVILYAST